MKEMETFVKAFGEGLRSLAQGVHAIADKLDSYVEPSGSDRDFEPEPAANDYNPPEAADETPDNTVSQEKPATTATAVVHEAIIAATKPITMDELSEQTGFNTKKLNNIIYRLRRQNKIKSVRKGVYTKK
jgi:predicted Rossmann fold nucleotide-binding protein DprA/Smf involved in DNA uptake